MKTLERVRQAITVRLAKQSEETLLGVKKAQACIHHLHALGCTVIQVTVRNQNICVDVEPPQGRLTGVRSVQRINGPYQERVMVTRCMGCQVQWVERYDLRPASARA